MKTYITKQGYVKYTSGLKLLKHRHVWEQHNGEIPKGMHVHHINGDKQDNNIDNLALVTATQNNQKMDKAGKGYSVRKFKTKTTYESTRNNKYIGSFGTACGAYMASRMAYITHG